MEIKLNVAVLNSDNELSAEKKHLLSSAIAAVENAYAPYSKFNVGAAVLLSDGTIVTGNNQENLAFPSGLCAERVALFAANSNHKNKTVKAIAISTSDTKSANPLTPCGACRQVIVEYEKLGGTNMEVILHSLSGKIFVVKSAAGLLPLAFDGEF